MKKLIIGLCVISSHLLLSGCFGGMSAPSSFYILSGNSTLPVESTTPLTIGVHTVQVPEFLDRPQIVLNETATKLSLSETNRWSEPVAQTTQRALIENLQQIFPHAYVQAKGFDERVYQRNVHINILSMTGTLGQEANLSVWWIITNAAGKELYRQRFTESIPCGHTYDSYVEAQGTLWAHLAQHISQKIR